MEINALTVGGTDARPFANMRSLSLERQVNGRSVLRCKFYDPDETFQPDVRDAVVFTVDSATLFGGVVWEVEAKPIVASAATGASTGYEYTLNCVDYSAFTDVALINGVYGPDTLDGLLATLVANLSTHGITLDGSQAVGPSLPAQGWEFLTVRQALDRLAQQTGWIWRISPTGALRMYDPTGIPASSIDITQFVVGTPSRVQRLAWKKSLNGYFNDVWLRYGPQGAAQVSETFTGDGVTSSWALGYSFANLPTTQTVDVVIGGVPAVQTLGLEADPGQWYINTALTHLVRVAGALASGDTVTIAYFAVSPTNLEEFDAGEITAHGIYARVVNDPANYLADEAQDMVEGDLRRHSTPWKEVYITTTLPDLSPLTQIGIANAKLGLSGDFLIKETRLRHIAQWGDATKAGGVNHEFQTDLVCVEGTEVTSWLDYFPLRSGRTR